LLSTLLSRYWWMTLFRGIVWVLFGLAIFAAPGISLLSLTLMFGFFAFVDGVGAVVSGIGGRRESSSWVLLLLGGLVGIAIGVLTFVSPGAMALSLMYLMAFWAMATGMTAIVTAINLRKEIEGEFWLGLGGLASIAFGVLLVARPGVGILTVLWLIGSYAIVFGCILVVAAFQARSFIRDVRELVDRQ
jgi:uncharacterized membrane protein HdeD (DUF308 family)